MFNALEALSQGFKKLDKKKNWKNLLIFFISFSVLKILSFSYLSQNQFKTGIMLTETFNNTLPKIPFYITLPGVLAAVLVAVWNFVVLIKKNMESDSNNPFTDNTFPVTQVIMAELTLTVVLYIGYIASIGILRFITVPLAVYISAAIGFYPFYIVKGSNFIQSLKKSFKATRGARKKTEILGIYLTYLIIYTLIFILINNTIGILTVNVYISTILTCSVTAIIATSFTVSLTELFEILVRKK